MNTNLEKDYRKWILFNNQLSDFQNLYELYTAVESRQSKGGVSIEENQIADVRGYIIEQDGCEVPLELQGDANRKRFLEYLVQHYFPNDEIEEWYQSKLAEKEKKENHSIAMNTMAANPSIPNDFKVHPKEIKYYQLRVFFSICFYIILSGLIVNSFITSTVSGVILITSIAAFILFLGLIKRIAQGFFIGLIKGNSVKLNELQYPEIYKVVKDQANLIGLKEVPEVYILCGNFNAFVTKFARRKFLVLFSEVLETTSKGNFEVLKFVVGHELGHIKRRHLSKEVWLTPSSLIPFLKQAHSRGCEYTCDRIGYGFSNTGAMEGILILATGKEIYTKININRYVEDANKENNFWVWISEKFLSHPHTFKRMTAIKNYAQRGY